MMTMKQAWKYGRVQGFPCGLQMAVMDSADRHDLALYFIIDQLVVGKNIINCLTEVRPYLMIYFVEPISYFGYQYYLPLIITRRQYIGRIVMHRSYDFLLYIMINTV